MQVAFQTSPKDPWPIGPTSWYPLDLVGHYRWVWEGAYSAVDSIRQFKEKYSTILKYFLYHYYIHYGDI